ncbi:hypothetical protein RQP54_18530 [Curvibacter sp. APW13]|uniref:hypothetical protein n=1 Tax=Curvibacter sp. APW13 TaxID=3077236 RepID=UPI0028DF2D9E|nr:hypothetical protein [Curvibacter sp. APW13]MDT8992877.1 hypothetical protein [Curvibacter sp. APW13]
MGDMPTIRRCVYALACLLVLYSALFVGVESPTFFRISLVVSGFFMAFPADQLVRLFNMTTDRRAEAKDFLFAAALDPSEGHFEPEDYTLVGVITDVIKLNPDDPD